MKIYNSLKFALGFVGLVLTAAAQIARNDAYYGQVGTADVIAITDSNEASVTMIVFGTTTPDSGSSLLDAQKAGRFTTSLGASVSVQIANGRMTCTYAGTAFQLTKESPIGPYAFLAGGYNGFLVDYRNGNSFTINLTVFASGRMLLAADSTGPDFAAFGALDGNQRAVLRAPGIYQLSFPFSFDGDTLFQPVVVSSGTYNYRMQLARTKGATLRNLATRATVTPSQQMTAGFVLDGGTKTVLIRAVGPTLGTLGAPGANADPSLQLYSGATVIATNDNWGDNANAADIMAATTQVGGFALTSGSRDAALLVRLKPGAYTCVVSSQGTASGDALIEVYEFSR